MAVIAAYAILQTVTVNAFVAVVVMAAAAYIDAVYIMPMFMDEPDSPASFGSWDVTYAEEGAPMKWAYGQYNRLPGQLIMAGHPWVTSSGGGGGKRAEPVVHTFWTNVVMAILVNKHYRIDRMDIEGNASYIRDVSTTVFCSFSLPTETFIVKHGAAESTITWQRIGAVGAADEWMMTQWHMKIENYLPWHHLGLADFMPGERLTLTQANTPSLIVKSAGGHSVGVARVRLNNPLRNLKCISSRYFGHVLVEGASVRRQQLVVDILGERGVSGLREDLLLRAASAPTTYWPIYFGEGVSQAFKNLFDLSMVGPNYATPLNDGLGGNGAWPRPPGGNSFTITYTDPRNWAKDVLKKSTPVSGEDYIEHYGGPQTFVDSIYQSQVGSDKVPSIPGVGYMSMAGLNLSRFGNRIPHMHFYVDARERKWNGSTVVSLSAAATDGGLPNTYQGMIETILINHGNLIDTQIDTRTGVASGANFPMLGINWGGLHDLSQLIGSIMLASDLFTQEWSGKIRVFSRGNRPVVNVSWKMLDTRQWNAPPDDMMNITDLDIRKVPRRLHLKFNDVDKDLQPGDVYAYRDNAHDRWTNTPAANTATSETRRVRIPNITLSDDQARPICERILAEAQENRQTVRLRLPSWYQTVTEGDILKFADYEITQGHRGQTNPITGATKYQNRDWYVIVEQVDIGADFFVEVEGQLRPDDPRNFELEPATASVGAGYGGSTRDRDTDIAGKLGYDPPIIMVGLDIPPLLDQHAGTTGIYLAYTSPGAMNSQPVGRLFEDIGDGDNWMDIGLATKPSIMGTVINTLADGPSNIQTTGTDIFVNLLTTDRDGKTLESTTDTGLGNGVNLAAVGSPGSWEIIQFKTATDESGAGYGAGPHWRLTDLIRGLRGSDGYTGTHQASEWFVLLDAANIHFHQVDNALVGLTRQYKIAQTTLDAAPPTQITIQGYSSLSLPVASLVAWRKSNGDVVFTWKRRTRARYRTFGTQAAPLMESTESYDVVIELDADRTINVTDTETATYTAAMQSSDSKSGLEITATVYQRDSVRGRGQPHEITVAQTQVEVGTEDGNVIGTENTHTLNTPLGGGMD